MAPPPIGSGHSMTKQTKEEIGLLVRGARIPLSWIVTIVVAAFTCGAYMLALDRRATAVEATLSAHCQRQEARESSTDDRLRTLERLLERAITLLEKDKK